MSIEFTVDAKARFHRLYAAIFGSGKGNSSVDIKKITLQRSVSSLEKGNEGKTVVTGTEEKEIISSKSTVVQDLLQLQWGMKPGCLVRKTSDEKIEITLPPSPSLRSASFQTFLNFSTGKSTKVHFQAAVETGSVNFICNNKLGDSYSQTFSASPNVKAESFNLNPLNDYTFFLSNPSTLQESNVTFYELNTVE